MEFGTNSMKLEKITCEQCATRAQRSRANSVQDARHVTYRVQRIVKKLKYLWQACWLGCFVFVFLFVLYGVK